MQFLKSDYCLINKATKKIILSIKERYSVDVELYSTIESKLSDFFEPLRQDIGVFIEYPYVDKVYRDSYYTYFSTKYREYQRDCIRISFFNSVVKLTDFANQYDPNLLEENFLGFCVLRPTFPDIIGRNLMRKNAFKKADFVTCIHKENILINGIKLHVEGFPHSSQDQESITCAETTVWAMMEYFGHKYAEYKPVLPSTIISKLNEYADKRMLPSNGLTSEQISFALKDFGFGTLIYADNEDNFESNLSIYIESGIPVIAILENEGCEFGHAILIIGRENFNAAALTLAFANVELKEKIINFSSIIENYIVENPHKLTPARHSKVTPCRQSKLTPFGRLKVTP